MCPKNFSVDVLIYFQIHRWSLKTAWPSAWDTRRWPRKGEPGNAAGKGQEIHAGRTAHPISTGQNGQLIWWMTQSVIHQKNLMRYGWPHVDNLSTWGKLSQPKSLKKRAERGTYTCACCGEQFLPIRADARYCSNACRQKDYRQRKANVV